MGDLERTWFLGGGQADIGFDCVVRESHTSELEVTENPVETGVVIADHAFMKPLRLEIEAEVSDVWLHGRDPQTGLAVLDRFYSSKASRSAAAWDIITGLQRSAEPFAVQTGLKLYDNMVIASLSADQDKLTAGILSFRGSLREVIRVSTRTVTYPPRKVGKPHRQASKKVEAGEKKTDAVVDQQKAKTALKQLLGGDNSSALTALGFF